MIRKRSEVAASPSQKVTKEVDFEELERAVRENIQVLEAFEKPYMKSENERNADYDGPANTANTNEEVTVCFAEETYCPVKFNSFKHGGIFVKTHVRPGETTLAAGLRAYAIAEQVAKHTFESKMNEFLANLRKCARAAGDS